MTTKRETRAPWYDGRLWLTQPAEGFRATSDAVMLGAAVPVDARSVLELGTGAGAVMLILAQRLKSARLTALDNDADILAFAARNMEENGFDARVTLMARDIMQGFAEDETWEHVVMNPPFNDPQSSLSPHAHKRQSMAADFALPWLRYGAAALPRRGVLTLISRADHLDRLLTALTACAMGEVVIKPIHAKADRPAHRILLRARKTMVGAPTLLPPLIMDSAEYTAIAHDGAGIDLTAPGRKYASPNAG